MLLIVALAILSKKRIAMTLTTEQVKKIGHLARIKLTENEVTKFQTELNKIFNWIDLLKEVNTDNVQPMYSPVQHTLPLREDVVNDGNIQDQVLKNAPNSRYGYYIVPKVVE